MSMLPVVLDLVCYVTPVLTYVEGSITGTVTNA